MRTAVDKFVDSQPKYVQPIFKGIAAAVPAMVFGVLIGKMNGTAVDLNKNNPAASENPMMKAQLQAMEQMGRYMTLLPIGTRSASRSLASWRRGSPHCECN